MFIPINPDAEANTRTELPAHSSRLLLVVAPTIALPVSHDNIPWLDAVVTELPHLTTPSPRIKKLVFTVNAGATLLVKIFNEPDTDILVLDSTRPVPCVLNTIIPLPPAVLSVKFPVEDSTVCAPLD